MHDLCEIAISDEHDISGTATDILQTLRKGDFGTRTPAQEAYLDMVLKGRKMPHSQIPADAALALKDFVAGLSEDLVDQTYGHVEVWDVRKCATLKEAFEDATKITRRLDLTFWDTRKVESMSSAFEKTSFDVDVSTLGR